MRVLRKMKGKTKKAWGRNKILRKSTYTEGRKNRKLKKFQSEPDIIRTVKWQWMKWLGDFMHTQGRRIPRTLLESNLDKSKSGEYK